jgi:site-specific DNA-methyltransferase (adenine-specific)
MYGMDRQNFMFKYYGHLAGFTGKQSLYWYFISNFPKASDLSKNIDKNAGAEREVVGIKKHARDGDVSNQNWSNSKTNSLYLGENDNVKNLELTAPATPLAQKYSGYKYSVAPLKQVVEEIMVFQKPCCTKSVLHDILLYEKGVKMREELRNKIGVNIKFENE